MIAAYYLIFAGMDDIPDLGDSIGLRRLYRTAVEPIRQEDLPEADKRAWIAELTRQYRAARAEGLGSAPAGRKPNDLSR
jgi:hypothetical protein